MENKDTLDALKERIEAAEAEIRQCLGAAAMRVDMYGTSSRAPVESLRLAVANLVWIAKTLGEQAREAERAYATRSALVAVLNGAGDSTFTEEPDEVED